MLEAKKPCRSSLGDPLPCMLLNSTAPEGHKGDHLASIVVANTINGTTRKPNLAHRQFVSLAA